MKKSDELFKLVKSMSKSEKRYFKLHTDISKSGEKNNYLRLFEEIDKQENYDEEKIKTAFAGENFIRHLFSTKSYLFNSILNSLIDYNREKTISYKLYEGLSKTEILISKGLKNSAFKLAEKTSEIARAHSKYFILEELLHLQSGKILMGDIKLSGRYLEKINSDKINVLEELTSFIKYTILYEKFHTFFLLTPSGTSPNEIKKLNWLTEDPLFKDEKNAVGYYSKNALLGIKDRYYWYIGDLDNSIRCRKEKITLLEQYQLIKAENPGVYLDNIYNYLIYAWFSLPVNESEELYHKLKQTAVKILYEVKDEYIIKNAYYIYFIAQVLWHEKNNEPDRILKEIERLDEKLKKFNTTLETFKLLDLFSMSATALFRMGKFENSLYLTNKVLNYKDSNLMINIFHKNLVKAIVIHYELGNFDTVESLITKLNRQSRKNERMLSSEKNLIKAINALINSESKLVCLNTFRELRSSLQKLSETMTERIFIISMGLTNWIERHIQEISNSQIR